MRFRELMEQADGIIDAVHAEPCRLVPMTASQYAGRTPDSARSAQEFVAVLEWPSIEARIGAPKGSNAPQLRAAPISSREPQLHVLESALPRAQVRVGDRIEAIERGQSFEVRAIHPEGMTRYRLKLAHEP